MLKWTSERRFVTFQWSSVSISISTSWVDVYKQRRQVAETWNWISHCGLIVTLVIASFETGLNLIFNKRFPQGFRTVTPGGHSRKQGYTQNFYDQRFLSRILERDTWWSVQEAINIFTENFWQCPLVARAGSKEWPLVASRGSEDTLTVWWYSSQSE